MNPKNRLLDRVPGLRLIGAVVFSGIAIHSTNADVITVAQTGPADFDKIQDAVDAAVDGDRIEVGPGTYVGDPTGFDPVVVVNGKSIEITTTSNDPTLTVISGEGVRRCVEWTNASGPCRLRGFSVDLGFSDTRGGGILLESAAVSIEDCIIRNCVARLDGGGVSSALEAAVPPVAKNCQFRNNQALFGNGGGLYAVGGFDLIDCDFTDCIAETTGGGVRFQLDPVGSLDFSFIDSCDFLRCEATTGGGVQAGQATLIVTNTRFDECIAGDGFSGTGFGGGMAITAGTLRMTGGRFLGCEGGESSGGLDLDQSDGECIGVEFTNNTGWEFGGAVYGFGSQTTISLVDCALAGNVAAFGGGGAIACQSLVGSLSLERCTFDDHLAFGPGYCINAPNIVTAVDCDFNAQQQNDAPTSHLALSGIGTGSRFENCRFVDAVSVGQASSIRATAIGGLEFIGCVFENNETIGISGLDDEGAIYIEAAIDNDDPIRFHDCEFRNNGACCFGGGFFSGTGGAIRVDGRTAEVSFCIFGNNRASDGGSLYGTFEVSNSDLFGLASIGYGGAANLGSGSSLVNCRISGSADCNYPWFTGGIITVEGCTLTGGFPEGFGCFKDPSELAGCRLGSGSTVRNTRFCNYDPTAINGSWTDLGGNSFNPGACNLADINGDGLVDGADLAQILALWGTPCLGCAVDINEDGQVDGADLAQVLAGWV